MRAAIEECRGAWRSHRSPRRSGFGAGTDAGFAIRSGKPAVLESLGLAGWGFHAKDEYIEIDSIVPRLYLTTRLLTDLGKER